MIANGSKNEDNNVSIGNLSFNFGEGNNVSGDPDVSLVRKEEAKAPGEEEEQDSSLMFGFGDEVSPIHKEILDSSIRMEEEKGQKKKSEYLDFKKQDRNQNRNKINVQIDIDDDSGY